ncbi:MAG: hypothetical protein HY319_29810 [Armatimonadetes bacterium]|nr:hypothetical protein [Armatimonadota bacterium]
MRWWTAGRGLALGEVVLSLSLLVAASLVVIALYHSALQYGKRVEQEVTASQIARNHLARARAWLAMPAHFMSPGSYPGASGVDPEHSEYAVEVQIRERPLDSPNTTFEAGSPERRTLEASYRKVRVEVQWGHPRRTVTAMTLVGAPPIRLAVDPVVLTPAGGWRPLAPGERLEVEAEVRDEDGAPVPDHFFTWSVRPVDGVMTRVFQTRDGLRAAFVNVATRANGDHFLSGGTCRIAAGTVYRGEELWGVSPPITLLK